MLLDDIYFKNSEHLSAYYVELQWNYQVQVERLFFFFQVYTNILVEIF
jgi:hypothetical protein